MMTGAELSSKIEQAALSAIRTGIAPEIVAQVLINQANQIKDAMPIVNALRDCNATGGGHDL